MNITIIGAGAVGGYFGAKFIEHGLNVNFLIRTKRAEQITKQGLIIKTNTNLTNIKHHASSQILKI